MSSQDSEESTEVTVPSWMPHFTNFSNSTPDFEADQRQLDQDLVILKAFYSPKKSLAKPATTSPANSEHQTPPEAAKKSPSKSVNQIGGKNKAGGSGVHLKKSQPEMEPSDDGYLEEVTIPATASEDEPAGEAIGEQSEVKPDSCEEPAMDYRQKLTALMEAEGRKMLIRLDPKLRKKAIWFKHDRKGKISKSIVRLMQRELPKPCLTYRALPLPTKEAWFISFAGQFDWNPTITRVVEKEFDVQASYTYSKTMSMWKRRWLNKKKKFTWMNLSFWKELKKLWKSKEAIKITQRNSANSRKRCKTSYEKAEYERRVDELTEDMELAMSKIEKLTKQNLSLRELLMDTISELKKFKAASGVVDSDESLTE